MGRCQFTAAAPRITKRILGTSHVRALGGVGAGLEKPPAETRCHASAVVTDCLLFLVETAGSALSPRRVVGVSGKSPREVMEHPALRWHCRGHCGQPGCRPSVLGDVDTGFLVSPFCFSFLTRIPGL